MHSNFKYVKILTCAFNKLRNLKELGPTSFVFSATVKSDLINKATQSFMNFQDHQIIKIYIPTRTITINIHLRLINEVFTVH